MQIEDLVVTKDGKSTSYRLPKGQGPECMSRPVVTSIGAGVQAILQTHPGGPLVELRTAGTGTAWKTLNRTHPSLSPKDGIIARILNPSSAEPVFEWKTQGGGAPFGHLAFPKLPKGCTFDYTVQKPTEKPQPETKPSPKPSATPSAKPSATPTASAPKPQTAGQTLVVPKGGVAAGAEIAAEAGGGADASTTASTEAATVAATESSSGSTTALVGAGLGAVLAGLGAFVLLRRRAGARR